MAENPSQQLFDLWKKQTEDAGQAWLKMLGQGRPRIRRPSGGRSWTRAWPRGRR